MRVIVGLGNPGERYRRTRHNLGFMVVDALAAELSAPRWRLLADSLVSPVTLGTREVLLAKPQTFMNRSGVALQQLLAAQGAGPGEAFMIVDDVALELGTLRIRERGSHGGHNGLRSVIECVGTEELPRLRIGIRKGEPEGDLADYVLAPFPEEDVLIVQEIVGHAVEAVRCALEDGTETAMSRYNGSISLP